MDLLAQTALRADAHAIADDQHPDHQFRIDRRTSGAAIVWPQCRTDRPQIEKAIDAAQQVVNGDMIIEAEIIEQLRRSRLNAHHRHLLRRIKKRSESPSPSAFNRRVFQRYRSNHVIQSSRQNDRNAPILLKNPHNAPAPNSRFCAAARDRSASWAIRLIRMVTEDKSLLSAGSPSNFHRDPLTAKRIVIDSKILGFSTISAES